MMDALQRAIAWMMNRVRVNRVWREVRDGAAVFVKERRAGAGLVIWFGNRFLSLARSGCCMFGRARSWMDWEVYCAGLLYPWREVSTGPGPRVTMTQVPGASLRELVRRGEADARAVAAAARELKRLHEVHCARYNGPWSHGDLHLDNILYDRVTDKAELIDFDTRHQLGLGAEQRQADDLKVMILEIAGLPGEWWRPAVSTMVEEYGRPSVLDALAKQLVVPRGLARVLWHTRIYGGGTRQVAERLEAVRGMIERVSRV